MYAADSFSSDIPVVAVIGAGASGTLAVVHVLREAGSRRLPLRMALIDRHDQRGGYLTDVLADAERRAAPEIRVSHLASEVIAIRRGCGRRSLRLDLAAEGRIDADVAILATGSSAADISAANDPLLRSLIDRGLVRPARNGVGLDADCHGAVRGSDGTASGDIYAIGPLLRGAWHETTAIPQIRDQAAALARSLADQMAHAGPRSAA
jgi:uncharacterized NAD(P)/FAD-binding protein YdhS